jgi:hypothetical protein
MDQRSKRPLSRPAAARASTARRLEPEAVQTPKIVFTPCGKWIVRAVVPRLRANPFLGEAPVTRFEAMGEMFLHEAGPGAEKLRRRRKRTRDGLVERRCGFLGPGRPSDANGSANHRAAGC